VGRTSELLICKSTIDTTPSYSIVINPEEGHKQPLLVKSGSNIDVDDAHFNLFPLQNAKGPGRLWVDHLDLIDLHNNRIGVCEETPHRNIIYYDKKEERAIQICDFLKGIGIVCTYSNSLQRVASLIKARGEHIDAVYLQELGSTTPEVEFRNTLYTMNDRKRPPMLIATTSCMQASSHKMIYISLPFGLPSMIRGLELCFAYAGTHHQDSKLTHLHGNHATYNIAAKLLGTDETGGVLETTFAIKQGTQFSTNIPFLQNIWERSGELFTVKNSMPSPQTPRKWHSKFEVLGPTGSRLKFWESTYKKLDHYIECLSA
ncbi:MAG: hypothetical protein OXT67_09015, partial [Zetaproteobacteria bacterium]|nr:hypothetical protein [Zetaproteobacteria bacterium]